MLTPPGASRDCRTRCGCSRAITPCLSLCCYHDFVILVNFNFSQVPQIPGLSEYHLTGVRFVSLPDHCYSLVCIQNIPDEPPKRAFCGVARRWCIRACVVLKSSGLHGLSGGFSLARRPVSDGTSLSAVRYTLDFLSRARPSLRDAPRLPLLLSLLQRWFRSTVGAATLRLLSHPDVGGPPSLSPVRLSVVYLTGPSLAGTPSSGASDGSSLVCLHRDPH